MRARANKKVKAQTEQRASFLVEVGAVPGDEVLLGDEVATSESLKATLASAMKPSTPAPGDAPREREGLRQKPGAVNFAGGSRQGLGPLVQAPGMGFGFPQAPETTSSPKPPTPTPCAEASWSEA